MTYTPNVMNGKFCALFRFRRCIPIMCSWLLMCRRRVIDRVLCSLTAGRHSSKSHEWTCLLIKECTIAKMINARGSWISTPSLATLVTLIPMSHLHNERRFVAMRQGVLSQTRQLAMHLDFGFGILGDSSFDLHVSTTNSDSSWTIIV